MFRILPYLIIVLVMTVFSKGLDFFKLFDQEVMPSKAAQEDDKPTKKKPELVTPNESLNTETSNEPKAKEDDVVLPKQDVNLRNSDYVHSSNDSGNLDLTKICNPSLIFSRAEIDLLQSLKAQKAILDEKENDFSVKQSTLELLKKEISSELENLKRIQSEMSSILKEYQTKEDIKLVKLVKIYENMKPKDAAKIFEELQGSVLVDIANQMKENKLAPILAEMNPDKAKELTVSLASKRRVIMEK